MEGADSSQGAACRETAHYLQGCNTKAEAAWRDSRLKVLCLQTRFSHFLEKTRKLIPLPLSREMEITLVCPFVQSRPGHVYCVQRGCWIFSYPLRAKAEDVAQPHMEALSLILSTAKPRHKSKGKPPNEQKKTLNNNKNNT